MIDQPIKDVLVFTVKREHGRGKPKLLHHNLLLPFCTILPLTRRGVFPASSVDQDTSSVTGVNPPDVTPIIDNDDEREAGNGDSGHLDNSSNTTQ